MPQNGPFLDQNGPPLYIIYFRKNSGPESPPALPLNVRGGATGPPALPLNVRGGTTGKQLVYIYIYTYGGQKIQTTQT